MSRAIRRASSGRTPSSSFDSSPIPSASRPPPIRSPDTWRRPPASARICDSVSAGSVNPSCETSRRPRRMRRGSSRKLSGETVRSSRRSRSATPSNGSTISPVSRRFAMAFTVKSRRAMSSSIEIVRSATISKSRCPGPVLRSARGGVSSMPAGTSRADLAVARVEAHADELAVHLHVLHPAVRLERRAQPGLVDARDEEVLVGVLDPEQLVANGAADDVGVEPEGADVTADRGRHEPDSRVSRGTRSSTGARRPRSRRARPTGAWRPGTSTAPAAGRPRGSCTRRSSPGSRRGR